MNRTAIQLVFVAVTLAFLGGAAWAAAFAWEKFDLRARMRAEAVEVTAVVVESGYFVVEVSSSAKGNRKTDERRYGTMLAYALPSGETVERTFEIAEADLPRYPRGAEVTVRYLPDDPGQAEIRPDSLGAGRWFNALLAALCGAVAAFLLFLLPEVLRPRPPGGAAGTGGPGA